MAEVLGIVGAVGATVNIIDATSKILEAISDLRKRYKDADLSILSLASQLTAFRAALRRIQAWIDDEVPESHHQLVMDLDNTLSCCAVLVDRIETLFSDVESLVEGPMGVADRWRAVFGNKSIENVLLLVERQTNALTLLLTACNCATISEQKRILEKTTTRKVLRRTKTDTVSLIVHKDTSSLRSKMTDNLSKISLIFEFDSELFSSHVYYRALRGAFKDLLRQQRAPKMKSLFPLGVAIPMSELDDDKTWWQPPTRDEFDIRCEKMLDVCFILAHRIVERLPEIHHENCAIRLLEYFSLLSQGESALIPATILGDLCSCQPFVSALGLAIPLPSQSALDSDFEPRISGGLTIACFVVRQFATLHLGEDLWQKRIEACCWKLLLGCDTSQSEHFVQTHEMFQLSIYTVWDIYYSHLNVVIHCRLTTQYHSLSPQDLAYQDSSLQAQIDSARLHKPKLVSYVLFADGMDPSNFKDASFPIAGSLSNEPLNSTMASITKRFHEATHYTSCESLIVWDKFLNQRMIYLIGEKAQQQGLRLDSRTFEHSPTAVYHA